jgi:hypothetical protein
MVRANDIVGSPAPAFCIIATVLTVADFARKVVIPIEGLSQSQIEEKVADAVKTGETMPRAYHQSLAPFQLPTVVE